MTEKKREIPMETQVLGYMLDRYKETNTPKDRASVLSCLLEAPVSVPVLPAGEPIKDESGKKQLKLTVPFLQNPEKKKFFPVYADPGQIPESAKKGMGVITIPFRQALKMALDGSGIEGIVLNPFTHNVMIGIEELEKLSKG